MPNYGRRPGDAVIDRYMPDATAEEREAAREHLREVFVYLCTTPFIERREIRGETDAEL